MIKRQNTDATNGVGQVDNVARFERYMRDFEATSIDDSWDRLRAHFTDDFVHHREVGSLAYYHDEGLDLALERWRLDVEHFDRQFNRRIFVPLASPEADGDIVRLPWIFIGLIADAPAFIDEGVEEAEYRDGRICRLTGHYHRDVVERMAGWIERHGELVPELVAYHTVHRAPLGLTGVGNSPVATTNSATSFQGFAPRPSSR